MASKEQINALYNELDNQIQETKRRTVAVAKMIDMMERYLADVQASGMLTEE